jgi:hypothetical protein
MKPEQTYTTLQFQSKNKYYVVFPCKTNLFLSWRIRKNRRTLFAFSNILDFIELGVGWANSPFILKID